MSDLFQELWRKTLT